MIERDEQLKVIQMAKEEEWQAERRRVRAEKRLEILRCRVGGHTIAIGMTSSSSSSSSSSFFLTFSLGSRARLAAQAERKAEKRQKSSSLRYSSGRLKITSRDYSEEYRRRKANFTMK